MQIAEKLLLHVASEGLLLLHVTSLAECLLGQLHEISETLKDAMRPMGEHSKDDGLERRTANATIKIDELLRLQSAQLPPAAVEQLMLLQRHAEHVAVLACCRFIDQTIMQLEGIPVDLICRLEAAFPPGSLQDDELWWRLEDSKELLQAAAESCLAGFGAAVPVLTVHQISSEASELLIEVFTMGGTTITVRMPQNSTLGDLAKTLLLEGHKTLAESYKGLECVYVVLPKHGAVSPTEHGRPIAEFAELEQQRMASAGKAVIEAELAERVWHPHSAA